MPHQVFISYSSRDEAIAREVVDALEADRLACWISCRDIRAGQNYQESIVRAIRGAQVLVLLFSENSNASREVLKELSVAGSFGVPVLPLRLSPVKPTEGMIYELSTCQWIDGWPDRAVALPRLMTAILELVGTVLASAPRPGRAVPAPPPRVAPPAVAPAAPVPPRPSVPAGPDLSARGAESTIASTETIRRPGFGVSENGMAALSELLTWHVGPIARVLMRRARTEAANAEDLCERLAAHMPGVAERDAFLRQARDCVRR